jgi:hypothetical protein
VTGATLTFHSRAIFTVMNMTPLTELASSQRTTVPATHSWGRRGVGPLGTIARVAVGGFMLGDVVYGHATGGWHLTPWLLALLALPAAVVIVHCLLVRVHPGRIVATGPLGHIVNIGVFLALWLTPENAPALEATSDAALIFYGASMLIAAARGTAGCEVTVLSNWMLRRDDEVGCAVFLPVDLAESGARRVR